MTDERYRDEHDPLVSQAYRDIAGEQSPPHVDAKILKQAKRATRPPYVRTRAWTRPLAWAAVLTLSLVIVLQVTQVPEFDGLNEAADEPVSADEVMSLDVNPIREAEEMARMQSGEQLRPETPVYCDTEARATREAWLACIAALELEGRTDEAASERAALAIAFPD